MAAQLLEIMQEVGRIKGQLQAAHLEVAYLRSENAAFRMQLAEFAKHQVVLVPEGK